VWRVSSEGVDGVWVGFIFFLEVGMVDKVTLYDIIDAVAVYNKLFDADVHLCFCADKSHNRIDREWADMDSSVACDFVAQCVCPDGCGC
jgi:hypothetical protein